MKKIIFFLILFNFVFFKSILLAASDTTMITITGADAKNMLDNSVSTRETKTLKNESENSVYDVFSYDTNWICYRGKESFEKDFKRGLGLMMGPSLFCEYKLGSNPKALTNPESSKNTITISKAIEPLFAEAVDTHTQKSFNFLHGLTKRDFSYKVFTNHNWTCYKVANPAEIELNFAHDLGSKEAAPVAFCNYTSTSSTSPSTQPENNK